MIKISLIKKKPLLVFCLFFLFASIADAQKNIVSVNNSTGTAIVAIPIAAVTNGAASVAISLSYSAGGIRLKDIEGTAGLGWQLHAGGQITRTVHGLPDDCLKDGNGNNRVGWLYNSNSSAINSFSISNVNNNCTNEGSDISYLNTYFGDLSDTEPDIFTINAPGLNCQFVFDGSHNIKTLTYQDIKIEKTTNTTTGLITAFTVTNDKGIKYEFAQSLNSTRTTTTDPSGANLPESNIVYYKNDYYRYKYGINYNSGWYLTKITDANGNAVSLNYSYATSRQTYTPVELYVGNTTTKTQLYFVEQVDQPLYPTTISGNGTNYFLTYNTNLSTGAALLSSIQAGSTGIKYFFNYNSLGITSSSYKYFRFFLADITTDQCNVPVKYHFDYLGTTLAGNISSTNLPDSTSNQYDYWGYYNGSSSSRDANASYVTTASLNKITYFDNGSTTLTYEPNDYYNSATILANGIRIKQIVDYDGISTANNITRNYSYSDPSTSLSSGKPIRLPQYSFKRPYNSSDLNDALVKSDLDLSDEDHTIIYSFVKITQAGAGSTLYQYSAPGTQFETSGPFNWAPATNYIGRSSCTNVLGYAVNQTYAYPFAPAPNIDFERGLPTKITYFNEAVTEVSESNFTYQSAGTPGTITGLRFDANNYGTAYAKYTINTAGGELSATLSNKVYDLNSTTLHQDKLVTYTYGSPNHKLVTQTTTVNSDGSTQTVNTKYSKDYTATITSDPAANAIYQLQQLNINIPIEAYTQMQLPASSAVTTNGALTIYGAFSSLGGYNYLPAQQLKFVSATGLSSFTPSTISGGVFSYDNTHYLPGANESAYDLYGVVKSMDDNHHHQQAVLSDAASHQPFALFDQAKYSEVAFSNFDNLGLSGSYSIWAGDRFSATAYSASLAAGTALSTNGNIAINAQATNEVFSLWINTSNSGSVTVTLSDNSSHHSTQTISFNATGSTWKYYEVKIPLGSLTGGNFTASFQSSSAINIDDVLIYPEQAIVKTYAYDNANSGAHFKIGETNTNGISTYYTNDKIGRTILVADNDKQITLHNTYIVADNALSFSDPSFVASGLHSGLATTFSIVNNYNTCQFTSVSYAWDFGDGSTSITTAGTVNHTYSSNGTYTVTCTVTAPGYSAKTSRNTVVITSPLVQIITSDDTGTSGFSSITFSQGGTTMYSFTAQQMADFPAEVARGIYTVTVHCTFTSPFGCLYVAGAGCQNFNYANNYTFTADLSSASSIQFEIAPVSCEVLNP